jgi:hypothetical protein
VGNSGHGMSGLPGDLSGWSCVLLAQVERIMNGFLVADFCLL